MKIKLSRPIIVEGKYDKIRLENIFDTPIITTEGFAIFKNKEKAAFIKALAKKSGIIILTDSDSAGLMIRNHLKNLVAGDGIINIYLPEIAGKERRKTVPSAEGFLGVEGIADDLIISAFEKSGVIGSVDKINSDPITKLDLYNLGLIGSEGSLEARKKLLKSLELPTGLGTNAMLEALNFLYTKEQLTQIFKEG